MPYWFYICIKDADRYQILRPSENAFWSEVDKMARVTRIQLHCKFAHPGNREETALPLWICFKGETQPSPFYSLSSWNAVAVLICGWVCPSTLKLTHEAAAWTLHLCLCRTLIEHTRALDPTRPVTYITDSNYARDKGVGFCSTHFNADTMSTWEQHFFVVLSSDKLVVIILNWFKCCQWEYQKFCVEKNMTIERSCKWGCIHMYVNIF